MAIHLPRLAEVEAARETVYAAMAPTPQIAWPLLSARTGAEVWVKHENHTPIGAFKVRGGLTYMGDFRRRHPGARGVITATRGNHGQSVAFAARAHGLAAVVVVPDGNSAEKNAAMDAFGGELVVHGHDYQEAREHAEALAEERGLVNLGPYEGGLLPGVATYALELFRGAPALAALYVPIGMGSGISSCIAMRDALGLKTEIIGVVAEEAPCYALSFAQRQPVATNSADTIADGLACRTPDADAVTVILAGAARVVGVSEAEIRGAMRAYYTDTHNLAEGAGAAPLAALIKEKEAMVGRRVGLVLSGGNVDRTLFREVLAEG